MKHQEVRPYDDQATKKQQVRKMFDNIAPSYDKLNRLLSLGIDVRWRRKLVASIADANPSKILDIATGTGDVAIMLAQEIPEAKIDGLDLSDNMLEIARTKVAKRALEAQVTFVQGDSEKLPYTNNTFDAMTVAFGVRNFEDTSKGLEECRRVLKVGGTFSVLEFSHPTVTPFKQGYRLYFRYILPMIGKITSKDPKAYQYLFDSVQTFPSGREFVSLLENIGFSQTTCKPLTLGICTLYSCKK